MSRRLKKTTIVYDSWFLIVAMIAVYGIVVATCLCLFGCSSAEAQVAPPSPIVELLTEPKKSARESEIIADFMDSVTVISQVATFTLHFWKQYGLHISEYAEGDTISWAPAPQGGPYRLYIATPADTALWYAGDDTTCTAQGATFYVTVPYNDGELPGPSNTFRIRIAEDDNE